MGDIKYNRGASNISGSLAGEVEAILSEGYADVTPQKPEFFWNKKEDDDGTTFEGDRWEFQQTGACGRPHGNER